MKNNLITFFLDPNDRFHYWGLLTLRIVVAYFLIVNHGWGKIMGGPEKWAGIGAYGTASFGIEFLPVVFGFLAAMAESVCAFFIAIGFLTRPSSLLLFLTMMVAANTHIFNGKGSPESALIYATIAFLFFISGPGKFSVDEMLFKTK